MKIFYTLLFMLFIYSCQEKKIVKGTITIIKDELHTVKEYVSLFPNKVVYIDIWASWCGPCLIEAPHSIELQEHYKEQNVVFLFLSIDSNKNRWLSTIKAKNITGQHVLSNKQLINDLESTYNLEGIPRYLVFGRKGKLLISNASKPSDLDVRATIDHSL